MFRSFTAHPDRVMHSYSDIQYAQCIVPFQVLHSYSTTASREKLQAASSEYATENTSSCFIPAVECLQTPVCQIYRNARAKSHAMTQAHVDNDSGCCTCSHIRAHQYTVNSCDRAFVFTAGKGRHTMFPVKVENTVSWTW